MDGSDCVAVVCSGVFVDEADGSDCGDGYSGVVEDEDCSG